MKRIAMFSALALLLTACAHISAVDPAKPADVGDGVRVMPQIAWNQISTPNRMLWTINGIGLDELHFFTAIHSGESVVDPQGHKKDELPLYDSKMLPNDIQDLVTATMVKEGAVNVQATNLAPCPFGTDAGFCFDLTFATADGLEKKGKVLAAKNKGLLDVFLFAAPKEYYYDQYAGNVDKLFASLQVQ
jgi:hypothetical protein